MSETLIHKIELERLNTSLKVDQVIENLIDQEFPERNPEIVEFIKTIFGSPKISIKHGLNPQNGNYEITSEILEFSDQIKLQKAKKETPDLYQRVMPICLSFFKAI
jgi:hypothetical protein